MNFAGLPPTIVQASTSLNTAAQAPTTAPSPIVTPIPMYEFAATHALSDTTIGAVTSGRIRFVVSCPAVHRKQP